MDPQQNGVAQEFDRYRNNYNAAVNSALAFSGQSVEKFTVAKANDLLVQMRRHFGDISGLDVIDVGCGIGNYPPYLLGSVGSVTGIDVSKACVARARELNPAVHYDTYSGSRLPYQDGQFHVAYAICVMHHVPPSEWLEFTAELGRVVRPGGLIVIYEHNPWNPLTRHVVSNCAFDRDAVLISVPRMRTLLQTAGLRQVNIRSIFTVPPGGRFLKRLDALFSGLQLGAQYRALATPQAHGKLDTVPTSAPT